MHLSGAVRCANTEQLFFILFWSREKGTWGLLSYVVDQYTDFSGKEKSFETGGVFSLTVLLTLKQYNLVQKMLPPMEKLHQNDFIPLFRLIADDYHIEDKAAERAAAIISNISVIVSSPRKAARLCSLASTWSSKATVVQDEPFTYEVKLEEPERCLLAQTLDAFSRIVMGQMHILFEIMDIPESTQENQHALDMYHDVYWYGQYGAKEARDLLFPAIRDFGWNGGYGIASKEVAEDARLAYQLVKALRREYVLPVTDEPIAQIIDNPQLM